MGVRVCTRLTAVWLVTTMTSGACRTPKPSPSLEASTVRQQLERQYEVNRQAFLKEDLDAIMALRTNDFHAVTPDNQTRDRAWMRHYTEGLLNGIKRWNHLTFEIDSLEIVGDEARAIVRQHLDRMALRPDGKVHHVETWATQREIWLRTPAGWKLRRVDSVRDQRRLVDGKEG
jgi:ketosteroid isomerase-like protein